MSRRISSGVFGRPLRRLDFQRQYARKPALPADHGLRPDDLQSVQNARCQPIQPGKYQTVDAGEAWSLRRFTSQHVELMTKRQDLGLQRRSRPEQSDQRQPDQAANISHQPRASPNSTPLASRIEFPTMTGGQVRYRQRVPIKVWKRSCARRKPETQTPENEQIKVCDTHIWSRNLLTICDLLIDMSEVAGQLCRRRLFNRADASDVARRSARPATTCRRPDVPYSKGTPSSARRHIVRVFRHLATAPGLEPCPRCNKARRAPL
jgi:hypothetical protein